MAEPKRINIGEFQEDGYLQEANRQFFHPLGLALEVVTDDETGEKSLGGVWDYRDDPEGMFFGDLRDGESRRKANTVEAQRQKLLPVRESVLGREGGIQPIGHHFEKDER